MTNVKRVPADMLIKELSMYLKKNVPEVFPPRWALLVKTGPSKQNPPDDPDWWYIRAASLLRKIYLLQPIGVERLASFYGGRKDRGVKPEHHMDGGRCNIRKILQQLEKAGLVKRTKKGRMLTPEGQSLLDKIANSLRKKLDIKSWWEQYS
ncbi:30S ribosomal protein S19e [Candidatus Geothermarchaeota archaeon]|nr:MAG: 30S ribosomal protein S19e [Candidatus Geothermarchaeota archaeon]